MTRSHFKRDQTQLDVIVDEYVQRMEGIHEKRLNYAELEMRLISQECRAFNILRQQLDDLSMGRVPMGIIIDNTPAVNHDDQVDV